MSLFDKTIIGCIEAKNHFIRAATGLGQASTDGYPTEAIRKIWLALAEGEVGTIITSLTSVAEYEQASRGQLKITRDEMIPAYRILTEEIHKTGSKIVMQLFHGSSSSQVDPAHSLVLGPSAVQNPMSGIVPKEIDRDDMARVTELFTAAAVRAKEAGFDGIELHGAHSCLLSQFLLPSFNRRTDEYGGNVENRYRFVGEIVRAVRKAVSSDYPLWIKIDSSGMYSGDLPEKDYLRTGELLAADGIDAIEVSGLTQPRSYRGAYYREAAERLSERIDKSVILTGGIRLLKDMEEISAESKVQAFGLSRPFIRDPYYLLKLKEGADKA